MKAKLKQEYFAMQTDELKLLIRELTSQPEENEWVEFKHNFHSPEEIGEQISALSNSACIHHQPFGYLAFGIEDKTHCIVGTDFKAKSYKKAMKNSKTSLLNV
jgi:predicted HTH transcriptional regulator